MGNFQKFLLLEIRYNLYFADNSVKLLAFLVMQCLWCIFLINVLLFKFIPLYRVFLKQLLPQAQVSFLGFQLKILKKRGICVFGGRESVNCFPTLGVIYVSSQCGKFKVLIKWLNFVIKAVPGRSLITCLITQTFPKLIVQDIPMFNIF